MIDWLRIDGFDWDQANREKLAASGRDISEAEAEQVFTNEPLIVSHDVKHSAREPRFHALGKTDDGIRVLVVFTQRGAATKIRVISVRAMSQKERRQYEQKA